MAEELRDASYTLPRVMLWAMIINGGMMFVTAVTIVYCIGDLDAGKQQWSNILSNRLTALQFCRHQPDTRSSRSSITSLALSQQPTL